MRLLYLFDLGLLGCTIAMSANETSSSDVSITTTPTAQHLHSVLSLDMAAVKTSQDSTTTSTTTSLHTTSSDPGIAIVNNEDIDHHRFELVINATPAAPAEEGLPADDNLSTLDSSVLSIIAGPGLIPNFHATSIRKAEPSHKSLSGLDPSLVIRGTSTGTIVVVVPPETSSDFITVVKPSETEALTKVVTFDPPITATPSPETPDHDDEDNSDDDGDNNDEEKEEEKDKADHKPDVAKPDESKPGASVIHGAHYHFFRKFDTFVIYGKNFSNSSLSPKCPTDPKSPCKHKFKGKGLKKALEQDLSRKIKEWEYTDTKDCGGNTFCPNDDWDFVVVARTHGWNWKDIDSALAKAGGPKDGAGVAHSDVEQLAGCPYPSRWSMYWDKLMIYLYGGNECLDPFRSS